MSSNGVSPLICRQGQIGHVQSEVTTVTATSTITIGSNATIVINNTGAIAVTIGNAPEAGDYLEIICLDTGGMGSTVVLPSGVTWDGTNDTATFDADNERIVCRAISATRWYVVANPNSVAFS